MHGNSSPRRFQRTKKLPATNHRYYIRVIQYLWTNTHCGPACNYIVIVLRRAAYEMMNTVNTPHEKKIRLGQVCFPLLAELRWTTAVISSITARLAQSQRWHPFSGHFRSGSSRPKQTRMQSRLKNTWMLPEFSLSTPHFHHDHHKQISFPFTWRAHR